MSSREEFNRYEIAHTALVGILIIPSFVLWICALCMARRRGDPARRFVTFFKIAFILWTIFLFWDTTSFILLLINIYVNDFFNLSTYPQIAQTTDRTFYFGRLFECIAHLSLLLALVELSFGIVRALDGATGAGTAARRPRFHRPARYAALALATVLAALELAHFALAQSFYSDLYGPSGTAFYRQGRASAAMQEKILNARRLFLAFVALLFVASVAVAAGSAVVLAKAKKAAHLRKPATILVVCALLWVLRNTWIVAAYGSWSGAECYTCIAFPMVFEVLDPVVNVWVTFIIMVLLFALAVRKSSGDGLWTIDPRASVPLVSQPQPQPQYGDYGSSPRYGGPSPKFHQQPAYPAATHNGQSVPLETVGGRGEKIPVVYHR